MNSLLSLSLQAAGNYNDQNPHQAADLFKILAVLAVLATAIIITTWPLLKADNIFSNDHPAAYGRSEYTKSTRKFTPMHALALSFIFNITEVSLYLYRNVFSKTPVAVHDWDKDHHDYQPGSLFAASMFMLVATFIYTFVDESDFARFRDLKFALKVWLGTILLSPLVLVILYSLSADVSDPVFLYFKLVAIINGSCFAALAALIWSADHFSKRNWRIHKKRMHILYFAQAALFLCVSVLALTLHYGFGWVIGWLVYAAIMALGIKYFAMETAVYSDVTFYEAEVVEEGFDQRDT